MRIPSIMRIPSVEFHRANSTVRIPSCANSIVRVPSCEFHRANSIVCKFHRANSIMCEFHRVRIPSCKFHRANSIVRIPSCKFHCVRVPSREFHHANFIVRIPCIDIGVVDYSSDLIISPPAATNPLVRGRRTVPCHCRCASMHRSQGTKHSLICCW